MDIQLRAKEIAEGLKPALIEFCQQIVRTPSNSGEEEAIAKIYADKLRELGYDEVFSDPWGNVVGVINGTEAGPTIMFNGHIDAVPVGDPALWDNPPFCGDIKRCMMWDRHMEKEEETEAICGRGAGDMKCGGASQIFAGAVIAQLRKEGYPIKGKFLVAAIVLEENGEAMGTLKLLDFLDEKKMKIDAMLCGEPSSLKLMLGHRGRMELRVTVYGTSCHGSSPWLGVNAVTKAAKLILEIEKSVWANGFEDPELGKSGIALTMMDIEPCELCIVPNKVNIVYDRRLVPGETVDGAIAEIQKIIDRMAAEDPDFKATVEINKNVRRGFTGLEDEIESKKEVWKIPQEHPFVKACAKGIEDAGSVAEYGYWAFSTDVPALWDRGIPSIGYSGGQEYYIHTIFEKARVDYICEAMLGNVGMYLEASQLSKAQLKR